MKRISFSQDEKTIQAVWTWYECLAHLSNAKRAELRRQAEMGGQVLDRGGERAREVAEETMRHDRQAMQIGWPS